jgi:hypothetical protein
MVTLSQTPLFREVSVRASPDAGLTSDPTLLQVQGRCDVALPVVNKSIRTLTVTAAP